VGEVVRNEIIEPCYWIVAVVDLLGQQEAWLKTDYLPSNEASREPYVTALQASLGVVRAMRQTLGSLRAAFTKDLPDDDPTQRLLTAEQRAHAKRLKQRQVQEHKMSDGIVFTCSLKPGDGHVVPMFGVYEVLSTCMSQMLIQLGVGHPLRGGIDSESATHSAAASTLERG
jgi:hypothetical protein